MLYAHCALQLMINIMYSDCKWNFIFWKLKLQHQNILNSLFPLLKLGHKSAFFKSYIIFRPSLLLVTLLQQMSFEVCIQNSLSIVFRFCECYVKRMSQYLRLRTSCKVRIIYRACSEHTGLSLAVWWTVNRKRSREIVKNETILNTPLANFQFILNCLLLFGSLSNFV